MTGDYTVVQLKRESTLAIQNRRVNSRKNLEEAFGKTDSDEIEAA